MLFIQNMYDRYIKLLKKHPFLILFSTTLIFQAVAAYSTLGRAVGLPLNALVLFSVIYSLVTCACLGYEIGIGESKSIRKLTGKYAPKGIVNPSVGTASGYGLALLVVAFSLYVEGETDRPITQVGGFYLNQPISSQEIDKLGLKMVKSRSTGNTQFYRDITKPEVEYEISTDNYGLIYSIEAIITLENEELADMLYDETIALWDAKYGGGNKGYKCRFYRDARLCILSWNSKSIKLELTDLEAARSFREYFEKVREEKILLATAPHANRTD